MSSHRFPGKVLAPFKGKPLVLQVLECVEKAMPREAIVLLTSIEATDDPLAEFVHGRGYRVFRGNLEKVYQRFLDALAIHPCERFLRVCADSPLLDPGLIRAAVEISRASHHDIVTNVFPRSFPKGQSVEVINSSSFKKIPWLQLTASEGEHFTDAFYHYPNKYSICNISARNKVADEASYAVDTLEDMQRLESLRDIPDFAGRL